jgi:hypothetical protein
MEKQALKPVFLAGDDMLKFLEEDDALNTSPMTEAGFVAKWVASRGTPSDSYIEIVGSIPARCCSSSTRILSGAWPVIDKAFGRIGQLWRRPAKAPG